MSIIATKTGLEDQPIATDTEELPGDGVHRITLTLSPSEWVHGGPDDDQ